MAFDGLVLNAVTTELKNTLIGGKVQKVYQPSSNEILLSIYSNGLQYALCLNVSANFYCAHLTTTKRENPMSAPNFCMLLRKHLINSKIANIYTTGLERIMIIEFLDGDENYDSYKKKLVIELMGKHSNILLLDASNTIIDALKHFSISDGANRNIFPKETYMFPTSNKIDISSYSTLENSLPLDATLTKFFSDTFTGISKTFVEYSLKVLNLEDNLNKDNYIKLANYTLDLINSISLGEAKCVNFENDYTIGINYKNIEKNIDIGEISKVEGNADFKDNDVLNNPLQVNFFLDDYYSSKQLQEQFVNYRNQLLNFISAKLKKLEKKLSALNSKLEECTHMEEYKIYGELITANLYKIQKEHTAHIILDNYFFNANNLNYNPSFEGNVQDTVLESKQNSVTNEELYLKETLDIPLDISLSPSDNAKKYFKKYHKLKNTYSIVQEQKIELENELNYLESIVYEIQIAKSTKDLDSVYEEIQEDFAINKTYSNSKKSSNGASHTQSNKNIKMKNSKTNYNKKGISSQSPITYIIDNYKVLVGRNNKQNDELTFKIANKNDIWLHVKDIHGSHVILQTNRTCSFTRNNK